MTTSIALLFALRVVTLDEAVESAQQHQPQILQARAQTAIARAQQSELLAPLLPQGVATGLFQLSYPGIPPVVAGGTSMGASAGLIESYRLTVGVSQLIWDFGLSLDRYRASKELVKAQLDTEEATLELVRQNARAFYFQAQLQKALIAVAEQTLANQERHLAQIQGFVTVGTRAEIDLAQARADRANARVMLITAQNNYEIAKAQLNQAMGVERGTDYDVAAETLPPLQGEDDTTASLVEEAVRNRPDLSTFDRQLRAQELTISSARGAYFPALGTNMNLIESGLVGPVQTHAENWNAGVTATWNFFSGFATRGAVREQEARLAALEAQREGLRLQVRFDVEQAWLAVRAARATFQADQEFVENASERLRLAEGRYQTGVGSIIELGDAQVQATQSAAQLVGAQQQLSTARAQLIRALGRK